MANIFFDTNYFINLFTERIPMPISIDDLTDNNLIVSTLSYHIFAYTQKIKIPDQEFSNTLKIFSTVDLTKDILKRALSGPTNDLEDNIQLHSALEAECKIFLTNDKELLKMKYFGKMEIKSSF